MISEYLLEFFKGKPAEPQLPEIREPFYVLATTLDETLVDGPEKAVALRKLLEGLDAALRSRRIDLDHELRDTVNDAVKRRVEERKMTENT